MIYRHQPVVFCLIVASLDSCCWSHHPSKIDMASAVAAVKEAFLLAAVAVCVVLLHSSSSMGQQPLVPESSSASPYYYTGQQPSPPPASPVDCPYTRKLLGRARQRAGDRKENERETTKRKRRA